MIFSVECSARTIVQIALVGLTLHAARAADRPNGQVLDQLPLSAESLTGATVRPVRTSVKWKGREYDVNSGIDVVMSVFLGPDASVRERSLALTQLAMLMTQLKGRPCLDELGQLYENASQPDKHGILLCFKASGDPRGIPVFNRTLDKEQDNSNRLSAASGLARWNIRRGVAELIHLFESTKLPSGRFYPVIGDRARSLFQKLNDRKKWGFPDEEIRKSIESELVGFDREEFKKRWEFGDEETRKSLESRAQVPREKFLALYIAEIKKWFAENEHRFPEWKPDDPLPEVSSGDSNKSSNE